MTDNDGMLGVSSSTSARTVLIVEDSENVASTLEMAAADIPGVRVRVAASGNEALHFLESETAAVGAIITDLNMPHMDGFELISRIRSVARHGRIPIIVVSADTDPATPQRIGRLGVAAFFPKPCSPAQVRRKLEQLLNGSNP